MAFGDVCWNGDKWVERAHSRHNGIRVEHLLGQSELRELRELRELWELLELLEL